MSGSIKRDFSAGVTSMSLAIWIEQAILFVMFVVYARLLGAETVGVAMMAIGVVLLGETLVRETFSDFLIQRVDLERGHLSAAFWLLVGVALIIMVVVWVAAPAIAAAYDQPEVTDLLRAGSVTVLFVALAAVPVASLRRRLAFSTLAVRTVLGPVVGGAVGLAAALAGWGVWSLVIQRIVQGAVTDGLVWLAEKWRPDFSFRKQHLADVWQFSSRMLGLRLAGVFAVQMPSYAIGVFLGPAALALYTAAWRLVDALAFLIVAPIRFVSQPAFAALRRGEQAGAALLRDVSQASSLITFASFAGVAAVASPLLTVLLGGDWTLAAPILQILAVVGLYTTTERINETYCAAMGRVDALLGFATAEALLGAVLCFVAAPYGAHVVAAAVSLRYLVIWPFRINYTTRLAQVNGWQYVHAFAGPAFLSIVMAGAVIGWRETIGQTLPSMIDLATSVLLGATLYLGLCWLVLKERIRSAASLIKLPGRAKPGSPADDADLQQTRLKP